VLTYIADHPLAQEVGFERRLDIHDAQELQRRRLATKAVNTLNKTSARRRIARKRITKIAVRREESAVHSAAQCSFGTIGYFNLGQSG